MVAARIVDRTRSVPASSQAKPPACRQPSLTARNVRHEGGNRCPSRCRPPRPGEGYATLRAVRQRP
ncbi:hypothetical protein GCM10011579_063780 [Streptomyces albiflavescens]|uniref:Uncharacterized protein n=1 Tax=Streptomyces albiflavescens TaxID=1623582 RepID=A0A917Y8W7_9ACTN|nr:hypothetical protein GCM10011579_063780 [Streptomyces albiflavescens]